MADPLIGTVLVVDDTEATRYVLGRLLTKAGHRVIEAASGAEGEKLAASVPDVMLIDMNLGDMIGSELTRRIKADPRTSSTMVVNMSASMVRTQDRVDALEIGADGYLMQPVDPQELVATVQSLLRIRRAEETVKRANQQLENFAYVVSHDLQEPLRMISSYLTLLELRHAAKLDDAGRRCIAAAVDASSRLGGMIRSVLTLANAERVSIARQRTSLAEPLRAALSSLEPMVRETQAEVTVGDLPEAACDGQLITQVFQNLVANAMKFRAPGRPVRVAISATRVGDQHRVLVADNGVGISEDSRERIFGMFERAEPGDQPGSGIGLAFCRRIIERHGGAIGVESREGEGSTFWFTLPA